MAKKGEAKVTFTAETSGFTKEIANINKSLGRLKSDLKATNAELKANGDSFEVLSDKQKILKEITEENAQKMQTLQKKLASCEKYLGKNSNEYDKLYKQLNNVKAEQSRFQSELKQTESALERVAKEADDVSDELDDLGNSFKKASKNVDKIDGDFTVLKGTLSELAADGIEFAVEGLADFAGYLLDLPQETKEFRTNIAKLQGATKQYGYDVEETNQLMEEMYGYFSDEQVATNAITNLQGMGLSQSELNSTLDSAVAVWTAYGDSIPIESLTESINETSQVGKVTGVLADALNWAGISEDNFNQKLEACKNTQERAKLVTDTLNKAYGESKTAFDNATQGAQEAERAQYRLKEQQAKLAEGIEPLTTKLDTLKAELLENVTPAVSGLAEELGNSADNMLGLIKNIESLEGTGLGELFSDIGGLAKDNPDSPLSYTQFEDSQNESLRETGNLLLWIGDVYDGIKNKGMNCFDAMTYASQRWGSETKTQADEVATVHQEKMQMMERSADTSAQNSQRVIKDSLKDTENSLHQFDPQWKLSKPSTTDAEQQREKLLTNTTSKLTSYNPSWKISKPNTQPAEQGTQTGLNNCTSKLRSWNPSWSIKSPNSNVDISGALANIRSKLANASFTVGITGVVKNIVNNVKSKFNWRGGIGNISWHDSGAIVTKPTLFSTPMGLQGVGDKYKGSGTNAEAILPLDSFYQHLDNTIYSGNVLIAQEIRALREDVNNLNLTLDIDGTRIAQTTAEANDYVNYTRQSLFDRGVNI